VVVVVVFWLMTPSSDVIGYRHFGGPCCVHLCPVLASRSWGKSRKKNLSQPPAGGQLTIPPQCSVTNQAVIIIFILSIWFSDVQLSLVSTSENVIGKCLLNLFPDVTMQVTVYRFMSSTAKAEKGNNAQQFCAQWTPLWHRRLCCVKEPWQKRHGT